MTFRNRITALRALGLIILAGALAQSAEAQTRLRLMAANLTSGNASTYDSGEGTRIFEGIHPDVVMIQEFKAGANTDAAIATYVTATFGAGYTFYREPDDANHQPPAGIPNGVISRYPIIQSGQWNDDIVPDRDFAWAEINIPGAHHLWAVSCHLYTQSATDRTTQGTELKDYITANVPADDYVVIGGDFNSKTRTEGVFTSVSPVVVVAGPYPADQTGDQNTNAARKYPYDQVLVSSSLNALKTPLIIGSSTYANGLVFDSRVYTPLSEVSPVLAADSGATNMQHMGIVKDFLIPAATPTPSPTPPTPTPSPSPTPDRSPNGFVVE